MNPKQFLLLGGIILVALGLLGMFVLGPTASTSALGATFWLDQTENIAHLVFGVVALAAYFLLKDAGMQKILVILVGIVAALVAVLGFINMANPVPNVSISNLELSDDILHVVVALWAFGAAFMGGKTNQATATAV